MGNLPGSIRVLLLKLVVNSYKLMASTTALLDKSLVATERGGRGEGKGRERGGRVVPGLLGILESWMEVSLD